MSLLPVDAAQARLIALARPIGLETVALDAAAGRYAAADIAALRDQPAADLSAMDGYALRFAELPGPLRVTAEITPGRIPEKPIAPGEAARIFTGAALPAGADTILVQEEAARDGDMLTLAGEGPGREGRHIRRRASDFAQGCTLIARGEKLTPARIALAALGGHGEATVGARPRVALLSTGDELVPPGVPTRGLALPASNAVMLRALLGGQAIVEDRGIVPDDLAATRAALSAAGDADIIVTTGGASVGDHDLVRPALIDLGAEIDFWKIAMKPGKPLMAGRLGNAVVLGLPGNPVSAFVTATLFLLPLVRALQGAAAPFPPIVRATLGEPLPACGARAEYLRGLRRDEGVVSAIDQDSAATRALATADALIVRAPHAAEAAAGDQVELIALT